MPIYSECRCIEETLHKVLKEAVDNLKDIKVGDTTKKEHEREDKLKEPLEALAKLSAMMSPEQLKTMRDTILATVPISEEEKIFQDLDRYLQECKCPSDVHIDWHKFPYGQATTPSSGKGAFKKKMSSLPIDEAEKISSEIRRFGTKMKEALDNPVTFTNILNHPNISGDQTKVSWGNTRDVLKDLGYITQAEIDNVSQLNKKFIASGGADLLFNQQNSFLAIREAKAMPRKPFKESR